MAGKTKAKGEAKNPSGGVFFQRAGSFSVGFIKVALRYFSYRRQCA